MELLRLPTHTGLQIIDINTIIRIQSISNYSKLFFSNGNTLVVAKVLAWFGHNLPGQIFFRVNRSQIISRLHVKELYDSDDCIILDDFTVINVSRRRKRVIMTRLKKLEAA
jgi:two-component system, LytTR family, response regulator